MAFLPKPMPQSARRLRLRCQFGSQRQQSSIGLPVPQEKKPKFLLSVLFLMILSKLNQVSSFSEYFVQSIKFQSQLLIHQCGIILSQILHLKFPYFSTNRRQWWITTPMQHWWSTNLFPPLALSLVWQRIDPFCDIMVLRHSITANKQQKIRPFTKTNRFDSISTMNRRNSGFILEYQQKQTGHFHWSFWRHIA